jgi:HAD superfamily hydrolase (TIGR01549 family)
MRVDTIFLDAGGVFVFPNWQRVSEALARQGVSVARDRLAAAEPRAKRDLDSPALLRLSTDASRGWDYFNRVLEHAGVPRSQSTDAALAEVRAYHSRSNLWEWVPDGTRESLARLASLGFRVAVVSNSNGTLRQKLERLGLLHHFSLVIDSAIEGVEKPDPRIFSLALERIGARAETTLHAGDFYNIDVVGARAAGLRAVLIDSANLYPDADCERFASLTELADAVEAGRFD